MNAIRRTLRGLFGDERGATAIEYGLLVGLIGIALVAALSKLGGQNGGMWANISAKVEAAMSPANGGGAGS